METQAETTTIIKRGRGRPKKQEGEPCYSPKEYAKLKTKELKICEICNCSISYYAMSNHLTSERHILKKNLKELSQTN